MGVLQGIGGLLHIPMIYRVKLDLRCKTKRIGECGDLVKITGVEGLFTRDDPIIIITEVYIFTFCQQQVIGYLISENQIAQRRRQA